jgi:hypothetical protein
VCAAEAGSVEARRFLVPSFSVNPKREDNSPHFRLESLVATSPFSEVHNHPGAHLLSHAALPLSAKKSSHPNPRGSMAGSYGCDPSSHPLLFDGRFDFVINPPTRK